MYTAVKAEYDRMTKRYAVKIVRDADLILCHHGYLVYESAAFALDMVNAGRLIVSWPAVKKAVVREFLEEQVAAGK